MTRDAFINAHKHELFGLLLDAAIAGRKGAELSVWVSMASQKMTAKIGAMYDSIVPAPPVPVKPEAPAARPEANGKPPASVPAQLRK